MGLEPEEVAVPDAEHAHQHRQVGAERAWSGSARPSSGSPPAARGSRPGRWRSSATARWPSPSSTGRRPSPRTRTCSSVSMPNSRTFSALVLTATKWRATAASSRSPARSQSRAVRALVSVSSVPKVLLLTMNSVSAGSRSIVASRRSDTVDVGHEPEPSRAVRVVPQGLGRHRGSEVGAADADVDHVADRLARVARSTRHRGRAWRTRPSGRGPRAPRRRRLRRRRPAGRVVGARRAVWRTARSSVVLMRAPANISVRRSSTPAARASSSSRAIVSSVTRCFE